MLGGKRWRNTCGFAEVRRVWGIPWTDDCICKKIALDDLESSLMRARGPACMGRPMGRDRPPPALRGLSSLHLRDPS